VRFWTSRSILLIKAKGKKRKKKMANPILAGLDKFFNTLDQKLDKPLQNHLKKVYSSLAIALMAAAIGAYVHVFTDILRANIFCTFGGIIALLLLYATPDNGRNEKLRLGYLFGFAFLSGLSTGPLMDYVIRIDPSIVSTAFFGTCIVFACFTAAAIYAPDRKYLYLGGVLASLLSTMFWMGLMNLFVGSRFLFQLNLYAGLAVMCGFVLYDTQLIMEKHRRGDNDYIWHSVDLFIDFMDIFRRLAIILAQKEERNKKKD
jgi:FtsH-binding integral membrane protein